MLKLSNNRTHAHLNEHKSSSAICTCPYGTMGLVSSSASSHDRTTDRDYIKERQVENAGIEPTTTS